MEPNEAVARLDAIAEHLSNDPETAHGNADATLLMVVPQEVADAYNRVIDACNWWACA